MVNYPNKGLVIHYEIACAFVKRALEGKFILTFDRKQVFINNKLPGSKIYEMADEMAKCVYPVTVEISGGNRITSIINYEEIISRSKLTLEKLSRYLEGDAAAEAFEIFEKHCSNPNTVISGLQSELYYKLLFLPLHTQYVTGLSANLAMPSPGINSAPAKAIATLLPCYNEGGKVVADVHGQTDDAVFSIHYQLYPEDHTVYAVAGNATYTNSKNEVNNMEFEIYHTDPEKRIVNQASSFLKDQNNTHREDRISCLADEEDAQLRKKSLWDIFR